MNMNQLAKKVCKREGKKVCQPIGQIKETMRVIAKILGKNKKAKANFDKYCRKAGRCKK